MSDKTEQATPYKLKKAKEQGQVNKSHEFTLCVFLLISCICCILLWPSRLGALQNLARHLITISNTFDLKNSIALYRWIARDLIYLWLPWAAAGVAILISITVLQTGFVWSPGSISIRLQRLHPMKGLQRLFSMQILWDTSKTLLKILLATLFLALCIRYNLPAFFHTLHLAPEYYANHILPWMLMLLAQFIGILTLVAALDKKYTQWKFQKDHRMSKQEVRDEYKQREGDPKIKSRIRQIRNSMRQKMMALESIDQADVLLISPEQQSVALYYDKDSMPAPRILCKASGELALHMQIRAKKAQIPVVTHSTLVSTILQGNYRSHYIERTLFPEIAKIYKALRQGTL